MYFCQKEPWLAWGIGEQTLKGVGYSSSSSARAQREVGGQRSRPDRSLSLRVIICGDIFNLVVPELRCWVSQATIRAVLWGKHSTRRSISYQLRVQNPPPAVWEGNSGREERDPNDVGLFLLFSSASFPLGPSNVRLTLIWSAVRPDNVNQGGPFQITSVWNLKRNLFRCLDMPPLTSIWISLKRNELWHFFNKTLKTFWQHLRHFAVKKWMN